MKNPTAGAPAPATQKRIRGHAFYPPKAEQAKAPALGTTESTPTSEKIVVAKWFTGGWTWLAVEVDWEKGEAFGLVKSPFEPDGEWGYWSLAELEAITPRSAANATGGIALQWVVERDCWFTPTPIKEAS